MYLTQPAWHLEMGRSKRATASLGVNFYISWRREEAEDSKVMEGGGRIQELGIIVHTRLSFKFLSRILTIV